MGKETGKQIVFEQLMKYTEVYSLFEPVVDVLEKRVVGFEILCRFRTSGQDVSPKQIFDMASKYDLIAHVDMLCRRKCIESIPDKKKVYYINISVVELLQEMASSTPPTHSLVLEKGMDPNRIVLEITDSSNVNDRELLRKTIDRFKELGFKFCLDNIGSSGNPITVAIELLDLMDYVKLPVELIASLDKSIAHIYILSVLSNIAESFGAEIIYKGIETPEHLSLLKELFKPRLAQGHLFGKPMTISKAEQFSLEVEFPPEEKEDLSVGMELRKVSLSPEVSFLDMLKALPRDAHLIVNLQERDYLLKTEDLREKVQKIQKDLLTKPAKEILPTLNPVFLPVERIPMLVSQEEKLNPEKVFDLLSQPSNLYLIKKSDRYYLLQRTDIVRKMLKQVVHEQISKSIITDLPGKATFENAVESLGDREFYIIALRVSRSTESASAQALHSIMVFLKILGRRLQKLCEEVENCLVAQIHIYDFVVLLSHADMAGAKEVGKKVLEMCLQEVKALNDGGKEFRFSVALVKGVPCIKEINDKIEKIFRASQSIPSNIFIVESEEVNEFFMFN